MTSAQLDHLRAIDAHIDALLALAAKRTPGGWHHRADLRGHNDDAMQVFTTSSPDFSVQQDLQNAAYIAACAGRAEAGWRGTKAAIKQLMLIHHGQYPMSDFNKEMLASTLAAWPRGLLTLP